MKQQSVWRNLHYGSGAGRGGASGFSLRGVADVDNRVNLAFFDFNNLYI